MATIHTIVPVRDDSGKVIDWRRHDAGRAPADARYKVRYRTPDGKSREKWFDKKHLADAFAASTEHKKLAGEYVDSKEGRKTVGAFAREWASRQPHRPQTAARMASILEQHILPAFDNRPIGQVRTSEVQAWVTTLSKSLAPSTTKMVYGKLATIFRSAVTDRVIASSPCTREIKLPRGEGAEVVPMESAEVRAMAEAMADRYGALVIVMAGTGLRPAEATGLCRSRIDFLRRTIRVDQQLITTPGEPGSLAAPKTTSSTRTIPVPQSVLDVLAHHIAQHGGDGDLVFTSADGEPVTRDVLRRAWAKAATAAKVTGRSPHDLRHFAASVLIDRGANVKQVQKHLGHSSATVTLDTYSHLWPDSDDFTRRALDAGLAGVLGETEQVEQRA